MNRVADIEPDWSQIWTPAEAEEELPGFKFIGPGWYVTQDELARYIAGGDVILVIPVERDLETCWHQSFQPEEKFEFLVYSGRNPVDAFGKICTAPSRGNPYSP